MSRRLTSICLPGVQGSGLADNDRQDVPHMIDMIRSYAQRQKHIADSILAAADEDFHIATYTGVHVHRNREILQQGKES